MNVGLYLFISKEIPIAEALRYHIEVQKKLDEQTRGKCHDVIYIQIHINNNMYLNFLH